ncbi:hypothetical protein C2W62_31660 [Candidatus Entotheonella serta]|nr:hypothetical protein C2W62_31660 [Candidatus Entotheonella serta]
MSVTPFECGAFFANDNTSAVISPGDNDLVKFIDDDGFVTRARIDGGDTVFATGFVSTSDMNLKTNVRNMPNPLLSSRNCAPLCMTCEKM